jgi:hypothetical protein
MPLLRMEELEPRRLLNGAGFDPPPSPHPPSPDAHGAQMGEPPPSDGGDHSPPGGPTGGPSGYDPLPGHFDGTGPQTHGSTSFEMVVIIYTVRSPDAHETAARPSSDFSDSSNGQSVGRTPASEPVTDIHGNNSPAAPVAAPTVTRPSGQTPFMLASLAASVAPAAEGQGVIILGPMVRMLHDDVGPAAAPAVATSPGTTAGANVPLPIPIDEPAPAPSAASTILPAALTALPPLDLSALEQGLKQFLDRIEAAGRDLVGEGDGSGLGPWVIAGTAAVVACEVARRQLRRQTGDVAVDVIPLSVSSPVRYLSE